MGTYGRTVGYGGVYDPVTQICTDVGHVEIKTNNGEQFVVPQGRYKHIPNQAQVYGWLGRAGFVIEHAYRNFTDEPLPAPITEGTYRATVWARKDWNAVRARG